MEDRTLADQIQQALEARFGEHLAVEPALPGLDALAKLAAHRVHRRFTRQPIEPALLRLLCACALSSPSKSDLQQGDIVLVGSGQTARHLRAHPRHALDGP